jgi:hypothetical protein
VACNVVQDANNFHQLVPMVESTKDNLKNIDEECGILQ